MEIWKSIEGTNGRLEVSNRGRVKSNLRDGRILKQQTDNKGYKRVRVTLDGVKRGYKVHRLVATAFVPNPNGLPQVNHIDGNKDNNDVANLEWVSCRDNIKHAYENGLFESVIEGVQKENAKSTIAKVKNSLRKFFIQYPIINFILSLYTHFIKQI